MAGSAMPAGVIAAAVAATRAYLRLVSEAPSQEEETAVLTRAAAAAIGLAEEYCGTVLVRRAFEDVVAVTGGWQRLRACPAVAIQGVTGLPADGAPFVLAVGAYAIDIDADGVGWVRIVRPGAAGRVAVSYVAGAAATWDAVAPGVAQGVAMLAAHLFDDRTRSAAPPAAVAALWRPHRRLRLHLERHA